MRKVMQHLIGLCAGVCFFIGFSLLGGMWHFAAMIFVLLLMIASIIFNKRRLIIIPFLGGLLNFVALSANNFTMPVKYLKASDLDNSHSVYTESTRLKPLCDIYAVGHSGNRPLAIMSKGDMLIFFAWPLTALGFYVNKKIRLHRSTEQDTRLLSAESRFES